MIRRKYHPPMWTLNNVILSSVTKFITLVSISATVERVYAEIGSSKYERYRDNIMVRQVIIRYSLDKRYGSCPRIRTRERGLRWI